MLATKRRRPELLAPPPLWLPPKRQPLRWNPACPVHGLAKRCQTQGGKIRTVDGTVPVGEEATCCCGPGTLPCTYCSDDAPAETVLTISGTVGACVSLNGDYSCTIFSQDNLNKWCSHDYAADPRYAGTHMNNVGTSHIGGHLSWYVTDVSLACGIGSGGTDPASPWDCTAVSAYGVAGSICAATVGVCFYQATGTITAIT